MSGPLELAGTAPALARIAADAAWRGTRWTVGAYAHPRPARAARRPRPRAPGRPVRRPRRRPAGRARGLPRRGRRPRGTGAGRRPGGRGQCGRGGPGHAGAPPRARAVGQRPRTRRRRVGGPHARAARARRRAPAPVGRRRPTRRSSTRPTSGSSGRWRPTRRASCASCASTAPSPRWTCAVQQAPVADHRDGGARPEHDRPGGGLPLPRPRPDVPQQPLPARPALVQPRAARGSPGLPGARGPALGARGDGRVRAARRRSGDRST